MKRLVFAVLLLFLTFPAAADEKRYSVPIGDSPATGPADAPVTDSWADGAPDPTGAPRSSCFSRFVVAC